MLPSASRMRRSTDFTTVVRAGLRARAGRLVVHHLPAPETAGDIPDTPPLVGLVVGKAVGNSVQRHATSRRLRAQLAQRLGRLPAGSGTVVRALPTAAGAGSAELGHDLDHALTRIAGASRRTPAATGGR